MNKFLDFLASDIEMSRLIFILYTIAIAWGGGIIGYCIHSIMIGH